MRMNEVVAANIRLARRARGWTQADLSNELRRIGVPWSRALVGHAEGSVREITVDEILGLSIVFGTTPSWWFAPTPDVALNDVPEVSLNGASVYSHWLIAAAASGDAVASGAGEGPSAWGRLFRMLALVIEKEGMDSSRARLLNQTVARVRAALESGSDPR